MKGKHGNYVIMNKCNDIFIISIFVANLSNRIEPRGRRKDDMTWGHFPRYRPLFGGKHTSRFPHDRVHFWVWIFAGMTWIITVT